MESKEELKKKIHEKIEQKAEEYAESVQEVAILENSNEILINLKILKEIFLFVFYQPKNIPNKRVDYYVGVDEGTINRLLRNKASQACRRFNEFYYRMKEQKDYDINREITMEALVDPKFGLDYQSKTQPEEFGKQVIEKTEQITYTHEIKGLPDNELERRIALMEKKLKINPVETIEMKHSEKDDVYEPKERSA